MSDTIYTIISRAEAKKQGLKYYFTGKSCKRGHIAQRRVASGGCVGCDQDLHHEFRQNNKEYYHEYHQANKEHISTRYREYYQNNKEHFHAHHLEYYQANKEYYLARTREHRQNNKEYHYEYYRKYRQKNPQKFAEANRIRSTRLYRAIPSWYERDLVKTIYQMRDKLNELWGTQLEVDHIIPINPRDKSVCGLHCWANLQLLDKSLNGSKLDSYQTDW